MAVVHMPDDCFGELSPFLSTKKPTGNRGGRASVPHRSVLKVIWLVLVTGCRGEDAPSDLGCSGRMAHRRLQRWYARAIWKRLHLHFLAILPKAGVLHADLEIVDSVFVRTLGGGDATGPSRFEHRKLGSKHALLVDANGVPLVIYTAPGHASDYKLTLRVVEDFPEIRGKPRRPRKHLDIIYADRGHDSDAIRQSHRLQGITPVIARKGTDHASSLGKIRSVVQLVQEPTTPPDSVRSRRRRATPVEQARRFSRLLANRELLGPLPG